MDNKAANDLMLIETTAPGVLNDLGLVKVGTKTQIDPAVYSENWMKPATKAAEKVLENYKKAAEK